MHMMKIFVLGILVAFSTFSLARAEAEKMVLGGLDPNVISETINRAMPMYGACLGKAGESAPSGKMDVKFVISGEGKVTKAAAANSTLKNEAVENCVVDVVKGLQFPEPMGHGSVDVTYPFAFTSKGTVAKPAKKKSKSK
jgi:TonB family protein